MNREIKFRAWNKEKKIMCYDNEDCEATFWDGAYASDVEMINARLNMPDYMRKYEYMQYIGKEDINKKEIYEGDIVKDDSSQLYGVVKYSEGYLQFVIDDICDGEQDYAEFMDEVEVIGNTFDNPELLKEYTENANPAN